MYKFQRPTYLRSNLPLAEAAVEQKDTSRQIFPMLILHIALALLFRNIRILSTIHALAVIVIAAWTALTAKDMRKLVPYIAYIGGAEVLWRMTKAAVFWEYGKYAIIGILIIALLKQRKVKHTGLPIIFILLFLPSIFLTVERFGFTERARELISFNLSGPLAVSICLIFFSQIRIDQQLIMKTVWAFVYPTIGIFALAVYSTLTATEINFGSESVFVTSGGYGPNQVSAILGLGALLLILLAILSGKKQGRLWAFAIALGLITQSFLTFSRGGIYNLVASLGLTLIFLLRKPSRFIRSFFIVFILISVVGILIFPNLEALTSGALSTRFTDTNLGSRQSLAEDDLDLFLANPLFGVGPGVATYERPGVQAVAAHTEYTRVLAEHGILGILALIVLLIILAQAFLKTSPGTARAWMVGIAAWPLAEMAHSAMRIAAVAIMLGLAVSTWDIITNLDQESTEALASIGSRRKTWKRF